MFKRIAGGDEVLHLIGIKGEQRSLSACEDGVLEAGEYERRQHFGILSEPGLLQSEDDPKTLINGKYVANAVSADPTTIFVYVFYTDLDPTVTTSPCDKRQCLAVARAKLFDVITAAFSNNTAAFPTLFKKFYNGAFTEPATSNEPNAASNSGHFTPVISDFGAFPSVIYDTVTQSYVMAYEQDNDSVLMRHGSSLVSWSSVDKAGSFTNAPNGELYTTLLGESGDPTVANGSPVLFHVKGTASWPNWPASSLVERTVHLSLQ